MTATQAAPAAPRHWRRAMLLVAEGGSSPLCEAKGKGACTGLIPLARSDATCTNAGAGVDPIKGIAPLAVRPGGNGEVLPTKLCVRNS